MRAEVAKTLLGFSGKFLLLAALFKCLDPALTIAATLNSKSPFVVPFGREQEADTVKQSFKRGKGREAGRAARDKTHCLYPRRKQRFPHHRQCFRCVAEDERQPECRPCVLSQELFIATGAHKPYLAEYHVNLLSSDTSTNRGTEAAVIFVLGRHQLRPSDT